MTGIYTITCLANGKIYVGRGLNIFRRKENHFRSLRENKHNNIKLQRSFNKYGEANFMFEVLVECDERFLISEEHYWATILNTHNSKFGFNIRPTDPVKSDARLSEESKKKIGMANTGNKHTPEMIAYMSSSKIGQPCHPGTLAAVRNMKNRYKFNKEDLDAAAKKKFKPVEQYDSLGNLIGAYVSIREAGQKTGFKSQGIAACCNGLPKKGMSYGFIWKFAKIKHT